MSTTELGQPGNPLAVFSTLAALTSDLEREAVKPPAIIVVGDVVAVAQGIRG